MNVTLIVDASHCNVTGATGCGYWVASSRGKEGGSYTCKHPVANAGVGELIAIYSGLFKALQSGCLADGDSVLVQSDCTGALAVATNVRAPNGNEYAIKQRLDCFIKLWNLNVEYKHVKAHSDRVGSRYTTIQLVDQRAKAAMRLQRERFMRKAGVTQADLDFHYKKEPKDDEAHASM